MSDAPARILEWDSSFFGAKVARVLARTLTAEDARRLLEWCDQEAVELVYFLAEAGDVGTVRTAIESGFDLVDIRAVLDIDLSKPRPPARDLPAGLIQRDANLGDLDALRTIVREVHVDSRFFTDPRVPDEKAAALFETWIDKSVEGGLADFVLVVDRGGQAVGYITGSIDGEGRGSIGLLGVDSSARGQGVAGGLIRGSLERFEELGADRVSVVTQGKNITAQRAYQAYGFRSAAVSFWFHRWRPTGP